MSDPSREAFEAYVCKTERYAGSHLVRMNTGEYRSRLLECDWLLWQAAVAWERAECAQVCEGEHKAWVNYRATSNPNASEARLTSYDAKAAVAHALAAAIRARKEKRDGIR